MSELLEAHRNRRNEVMAALGELCAHAAKVGAKTLASRLQQELVDKLEEDRFHLVVVGEFNHGKTAFVNALLGEPLLPVGVTPTTAVIHHVTYAPEPTARLVREDGNEEAIEVGDIAHYAVRPERPADDDDGDEAQPAEPPVRYLEVGYPAELLRQRIVLVDTPGVNDLCLQRADITYQYIPQADAVLFILDAGQPLKESERLFLKEKLIGQSRDKIIFIVAKVDIWSDEERQEALAYIREELGRLVQRPLLFPVSPEWALDGKAAQSGMPELVSHLSAFLAEERGRILLDNAIGEGLETTGALSRAIDARRRAMQMSVAELGQRIERIEEDLANQAQSLAERRASIREDIAAIRAWARRDLDRFCDDVIAELPSIIEGAEVADIKVHLGGFLETAFVHWAEKETQEIARALEQVAERAVALMREDAFQAAKRLSDVVGTDIAPPDVRIDTFGYDLGVFALVTVGLGMLFTNLLLGSVLLIAAPVLAVFFKGRVEAATRAKAKEAAAAALREASSRVAPKLDEMIDGFAQHLDAWVVAAGKELHRELIDVLETARRERGEAVPNAEEAARDCDALEQELGALRERLGDLRASLWGAGPGEPASARPSEG